MASGYLSIEAGDSIVKVCQIQSKGKGAQLSKAFMFRTPTGTVKDGVIEDPGALAGKLNERLLENGLSGVKNVVFTLATAKVATREATLPPVKENRIKEILDQNMSEYFPMDISKYQIDYGMVKQVDEGGSKGISVTLMAAPLSIVDSYMRFAQAAGLTVDAIDYAGNSQFQLMKSLGSRKVSMYVNVDCQYSFVTIIQGGVLVFQRMLPYGGNEYIEAYRAAIQSKVEYTDALRSCCVPLAEIKARGILTAEVVQESLSRVVTGIARSLDFFNTLRWKDPLEEVVLIGTCARLGGLREAVAATSGHEYVAYLEDSPAGATLGVNAAMISAFVSAYGASIAPAQFLPEEILVAKSGKAKEVDDAQKGRLGTIICAGICAICVIAGGFMAFTSLNTNRTLTNKLDSMKKEIDEKQYIEAVEARYEMYLVAESNYLALERLIESEARNKGLVRFFEEFENKMPAGLLLMTAVCNNESVTMSVRVPTLGAAAKAIVQLRSFESIAGVGITSVSEEVDEAGIPFYSFTVSCTYKELVFEQSDDASGEES